MSPDDLELPTDPAELRAFAEAMRARLAVSEQALEAERAAHDETREKLQTAQNSIKLTALQIEKFKVQLARLRRMKFGQSSERLALHADQLELTLEDLEAEHAHAECVIEGHVPEDSPARAAPRKPRRAPLPDHLPRDEVVHAVPDADGCSACGGTMGKLGEDVTEVLEYVPGRFRVVRHVRPKLSCNRCDAISQAPAPALPVPRGRAGPGLLAHVIVSKFADHLPLYRQSQIYAREGVELSRSTMADWLGQASWLLQPLVDRIADHVMASVKLHADDTPVPVLAPGTGKTATGRLWVYLRDNRRWSHLDKPAALFRYSPDRKGERPREHLKSFAGFLQADAYAGYERLYASDRQPAPITPVACWAHARRKLNDVYKADPNSAALDGLQMIGELYDVERQIVREPADFRRKARKLSKLKALDFFAWANEVLSKASTRSPLAEALRYGSAGERCMALPVVTPVGEKTTEILRDKLVAEIEKLRVGISTDPDAHYGPVVSAQHKARIEDYIQMAIDEGAELVVDGRGFSLQGYEEGYFLAPTLLDHVKPEHKSYQDEIFGPVLQILRADTFEEAISYPSRHQYGNGVAIFTRNGPAAREFASQVEVGMVGINVPIPVPVSYHSFGGWKRSGFGDLDQYGVDGIRFYTRTKKVTQRWPSGGSVIDQSFVIPTMS